ncbi:MAG: electron transporter [Flaviaesturariibacter sp.]|nr:electron transporter [Flaviaesturariibacter sp.]
MALLADTIACRLCKSNIVMLLLIILSALSCKQNNKSTSKEVLPFYNTAEFDASWIEENDSRYSRIHTIDSFTLQNQLGQTIRKDSLDGFIYVANFFFTTCAGICPKMTTNLKSLQDTFAANNQIKLVSFSVMPWVDSVPKLKEYAEANNINPSKWYLLTGDKEKIYRLARTSFFAEKGLGLQKNADEFLHTESMLLIDKKGRIRGIYNATQKPDIERVIDDITVLLKE